MMKSKRPVGEVELWSGRIFVSIQKLSNTNMATRFNLTF